MSNTLLVAAWVMLANPLNGASYVQTEPTYFATKHACETAASWLNLQMEKGPARRVPAEPFKCFPTNSIPSRPNAQ